MKRAIAYIDGSGNSARIQACAVSMHIFPDTTEPAVAAERTKLLPRNTTNNVGEYNGLLLAIYLAKELGVEALEIRSDSRLIVEQTNGNWRCKDPQLRQLRERAWAESQSFQEISLSWVPRRENSIADALCREAIKAAEASA